jgi:glycerol-3-phosphate dehydrogenase subunit C
MAVCPVARVTPLFPGPKQAGPGAQRFRSVDEPSVDKWIDLCIGCHLCDMVCSSGVNISELNLIAKAKYLDEKGRPLRDWLLTHASLFGGLGSFFSRLVNPFMRNPIIRRLLDIFLKIDRRREIPGYESPTFRQWFKGHPFRSGRKIAYFYGCYTNTNEVDVAKAAVQVLEANGIEVVLPSQKCCGIPMLGNGDFQAARKMGLFNVPSLLKVIRSGLDLVFSSTSCGHMIKHEYAHLLNIPGAGEVAEHTFDLFEFLRDLQGSGRFNTSFKELPLKAAYFSPCHLKSLGIGFPAFQILQQVPGLTVDYIEADCCGLGGTFGFKKEKYEISQEIGRDLAEAIDGLKPEVVLSDCEGCRMQIRHLTGLKVLHPIQILRDALTRREGERETR